MRIIHVGKIGKVVVVQKSSRGLGMDQLQGMDKQRQREMAKELVSNGLHA